MAEIDPRIRNLSYSTLLQLHECPRKFQLYKLNAPIEQSEDQAGSLTFAYGKAVGKGIQDILENKSLGQCLFEAFVEWEVDLESSNPKQNKSFWGALAAISQFHSMREHGYLDGYELVQYKGAPACELSFVIHLPNDFKYRGFVDAVLEHKDTGRVMVLEAKTTAATSVNPAQYKNSAQAIGYSIVLDALFPELSSYEVLYLVYQAKSESFVQLPFEKSYYSRALWIRELLLDVDTIQMYEEADIYPMHGESCYQYFRECPYLQTCTLSTERLTSKLSAEDEQKLAAQLDDFQIHVTLDDLIKTQLSKDVQEQVQFVDGELL